MKPIVYRFCQQDCTIIKEDATRVSYSYSHCQACKTYYGHFDNKIHFYEVETIYRDRFYIAHTQVVFKEYSVKVRTSPGFPSSRTVLHLRYDPKVTPSNIQFKIKTLLNFS